MFLSHNSILKDGFKSTNHKDIRTVQNRKVSQGYIWSKAMDCNSIGRNTFHLHAVN